MDNKFDGNAKLGYYDYSGDGSYHSDNNNVCCANKIPCSKGNTINILFNKSFYCRVIYYNASGTKIGYNTFSDSAGTKFSCVANVDNVAYFTYYASSNGSNIPTLSDAGCIRVYVNNAIDKLNADLAGMINKTVKPSSTISANAWVTDVFSLPTPIEYATYTLFNTNTGAFSHLTKKSDGKIFSEVALSSVFYNICGFNK